MRTRTRRAGGSAPGAPLFRAAVAAIALCAFLFAAGDKDKKAKAEAPYALIAGTVFRPNGLSLPRAEVAVAAAGDSKEARKFKKTRYVTDSRGEFAIRVPAIPMQYTVTVVASGYETQGKSVTIAGEDRIDVFFRLEPASK